MSCDRIMIAAAAAVSYQMVIALPVIQQTDGGCGRHCGIYDRDSRNLDQRSQSHPLHSIRKSARGELVDSISPPLDFDGGINKASE